MELRRTWPVRGSPKSPENHGEKQAYDHCWPNFPIVYPNLRVGKDMFFNFGLWPCENWRIFMGKRWISCCLYEFTSLDSTQRRSPANGHCHETTESQLSQIEPTSYWMSIDCTSMTSRWLQTPKLLIGSELRIFTRNMVGSLFFSCKVVLAHPPAIKRGNGKSPMEALMGNPSEQCSKFLYPLNPVWFIGIPCSYVLGLF